MIGDISLATNIYIITGYTDMRRSIDGLYAIVMDKLGEEVVCMVNLILNILEVVIK